MVFLFNYSRAHIRVH